MSKDTLQSVSLSSQFLELVEPLWRFLVLAEPPAKADVIFVFGSQDLSVPSHAAALYKLGYSRNVLVSGNYGRMTKDVFTKPEALVFKDCLVKNGVPVERGVAECDATNTLENVRFGVKALGRRELKIATALIVGKPFVMRRCRATFARQAPEIRVRCCPPTDEIRTSIDREPGAFAQRLVSEIERLDRYGLSGDIRLEKIPLSVRTAVQRIQRGQMF